MTSDDLGHFRLWKCFSFDVPPRSHRFQSSIQFRHSFRETGLLWGISKLGLALDVLLRLLDLVYAALQVQLRNQCCSCCSKPAPYMMMARNHESSQAHPNERSCGVPEYPLLGPEHRRKRSKQFNDRGRTVLLLFWTTNLIEAMNVKESLRRCEVSPGPSTVTRGSRGSLLEIRARHFRYEE